MIDFGDLKRTIRCIAIVADLVYIFSSHFNKTRLEQDLIGNEFGLDLQMTLIVKTKLLSLYT